MKNKYLYLLKNMSLLTISNLGGRMLAFFLTPLYTSILTTSEYGTYDLYTTTVSLLAPILSVSISDAVLRFSLDKKNNKKDICTVGLRSTIISVIIFFLLITLNYYFNIIPMLNEYPLYLLLYFAGDRIYSYLSAFTKGIDDIKSYAISGLLNSASTLILNILFLVVFKIGISGYFLANILALFISIIYLSIKIKLHKYICFHLQSNSISKKMKTYSRPLILNSISWWINNVSDRYIILWLCSTSANGIYSVAYKIPSIINTFDAIFHQAWTLSAVKEFNEKNKDFYSNIYKLYNFSMVFCTSLLIIFDQLLAKILYAKDFYEAWKFVPFLIISSLFACIGSVLGGIFSANMNSSILAKSTSLGAIINIILNIILIKLMGPLGAAISTMISYCIVWVVKYISASKIMKLNINLKRDILAYILLVLQAVLLLTINNICLKYALQVFIICLITVFYIHEFKIIIKKAYNLIIKFRKGINND